jgi:hypothetical protein
MARERIDRSRSSDQMERSVLSSGASLSIAGSIGPARRDSRWTFSAGPLRNAQNPRAQAPLRPIVFVLSDTHGRTPPASSGPPHPHPLPSAPDAERARRSPGDSENRSAPTRARSRGHATRRADASLFESHTWRRSAAPGISPDCSIPETPRSEHVSRSTTRPKALSAPLARPP